MAETDSVAPAKKAVNAAKKAKATHPTYLEMAKDAIVSLGDKKGATVPAIQSYIAGKYTLDTETVRVHLKPALAKGLENGTFKRPKDSDSKGFTGRFKLNKEKAIEEEKAKKLKEKEKAAKEKKKEKDGEKAAKKKTTKSPSKKTTDASKPKVKATKRATPTKKTAKKSPKKTSSASKPKAAKAKLKTPKKITKKITKSKSLSVKKVSTPAKK